MGKHTAPVTSSGVGTMDDDMPSPAADQLVRLLDDAGREADSESVDDAGESASVVLDQGFEGRYLITCIRLQQA